MSQVYFYPTSETFSRGISSGRVDENRLEYSNSLAIVIAQGILDARRIVELETQVAQLVESHKPWWKRTELPVMDAVVINAENRYVTMTLGAADAARNCIATLEQENAELKQRLEVLHDERGELMEIVGGNYAIGAFPIYLRSIIGHYQDEEERLESLRRAVEPFVEVGRTIQADYANDAYVSNPAITVAKWRELVRVFDGEEANNADTL